MFPFARLFKEFIIHRNAPPLGLTDTHVSHHLCWPWDLDMWAELNNGRTLTLYDLGRLPLAMRVGLVDILKRNRWGLTMAGASVRYRKRVRVFDKITMQTRALCWDDRFFYLEQSMWVRGQCTSHALYRSAVTDKNGMIPTAQILAQTGEDHPTPDVPAWVQDWINAESQRPWPPEKFH